MGFREMLQDPTNFEGLTVITDEMLGSLQNELAEMLNELAVVFCKHHISWGITGGNALGAVRNQDFIPWDDDIDINISRRDYARLELIFETELKDRYILKKPGDMYYLYHFPQIHKKNTTYQLLQSDNRANDGIFIDIFIVENTFDNWLLNLIHGLGSTFFLFADSAMRLHACRKTVEKYCVNPRVVKAVRRKNALSLFFRFLPLEKWLYLSDRWFALSKNEASDKVVIPSGAKHFWGERYDRDVILPFVPIVVRQNSWHTLHRVKQY